LETKNAGSAIPVTYARTPLSNLSQAPKGQSDIHLRILATSDVHMHILPFDYCTGTGTDTLGLARTAGLIAQARSEAANCLLFDNGDFLQGSPMGTYVAQSSVAEDTKVHPIFAAMNHLRYDAGTFGNHEFNFGLDFLESALQGATFPVVSANVHKTVGAVPLVPPYVILDRNVVASDGTTHTIRIGVIGFTPPQILIWDHWHLAGKLTTQDIVDAAAHCVPQMKAEGADLIIALSHSGIGPSDPSPDLENASAALAKIAGIDAIIAGHSHLVFPSRDFTATADVDPDRGTLCGKPAVMPGFNGSHLGVIDLFLSHGFGQYRLRDHRVEVRPIWQRDPQGNGIALVESCPDLTRLFAAVHLNTLDWVERPIGTTSVPLHSYFALVADAPALQVVAVAQISHAQKMLAKTPFANLPVIASVAPFKAGGRGGPENYTYIPAGPVKLRHATDLYIHPNTGAAILLTGAEIVEWLEYAAGLFNQVLTGGKDAPLINPDFPSFNFEMLFGLTYQIDLSKPPRFVPDGTLTNPDNRRIVDVRYGGSAINPSANFVVATNSYRAVAKNIHLHFRKDSVLFRSTESILDLVQDYFLSNQAGASNKTQNRRFLAMPGTTVTFDTSPKAVAFLRDLPELRIEPMHLLPDGFRRFRLHL
jgi:2',3'-cyclic-nucleotide 2'-phosphodiesterase / 3'-nucleotidase